MAHGYTTGGQAGCVPGRRSYSQVAAGSCLHNEWVPVRQPPLRETAPPNTARRGGRITGAAPEKMVAPYNAGLSGANLNKEEMSMEGTDPVTVQQPEEREASDLKPLLGCRIAECDDVEFLRDAVEKLWQIVDDIDTFSDIAKSDDKLYRRLVKKKQSQRWEFTEIVSDGYDIYRKAP